MKLGLVLGAGGLVGMAYHVGALHALEVEAGLTPGDADLIVGTSAGSIVGAYLRAGWSMSDLWSRALNPPDTWEEDDAGHGAGGDAPGRDPLRLGPVDPARVVAGIPPVLVPSFTSPCQQARRFLGSAWVLTRVALRVPLPPLPRVLRRTFPGGLFDLGASRTRLETELPESWPAAPLWLCTFDIVSERRVVLGQEDGPAVTLPRGVRASCAIPGLYPPVRVGRRVLVDGGSWSCTNLDLAGEDGCDLILGIAPLAFDTAEPPGLGSQLARRWPARSLSQETAGARRRGAEVLLVRPTGAEVRAHGVNLMRRDGLDRIASAAYESTARLLATDRFKSTLGDLGPRREGGSEAGTPPARCG
ncbi:MAG TPA: patatin-like phospholipase family protein [Acidimicrobiales bacterium]|jgi:NTE family protein|nr:patatin-like phospholipase family protein [Acidimicrobiales bacterium]